jgi:hypothetical protein
MEIPMHLRHAVAAALAPFFVGSAFAALPHAIQFDGRCDALTDIRYAGNLGKEGTGIVRAVWDRSACGADSTSAVGFTGRLADGDTISYTPDTASLGLAPMLVRLYGSRWESRDTLGHLLANGTWSPMNDGAAVRSTSKAPSLLDDAGQADTSQAGEIAPPPDMLPSELHFDDHCDGITHLVQKKTERQSVFHGTWDLSQCGLASTTMSMFRDRNHGRRAAVGTYDTLSQGLGYPSVLVQVRTDRTWYYLGEDGSVVAQGTWTPGPPVAGGSVSMP